MEFDRIYFYIFAVLLVAFMMLICVYALYLVQQKVTNMAMTSADVAFFPVRATAYCVRLFFRIVLLGFDATLFVFRLFLLGVKLILSALETALMLWRAPIIFMIAAVQRVRRLRKNQKTNVKPQTGKAKLETIEPKAEEQPSAEEVQEETVKRIWGQVGLRDALSGIRRAKNLLRPDLLAVHSLREAKNYLRRRAGLESLKTGATDASSITQ